MTGIEAEQLGRRLAIHLRRNDFKGCQEIINSEERQREILDEKPTAIAEIGINLRWVNMLEEMGCIYIKDLEGLDLKHFLRTVPDIGDKAIDEILSKIRPYLSPTGRMKQ